ncbi:MAG: sugar transporter [Rhodobacteraceae bacterium]|nr:sugar transporter [Paracoccaceae bacterium]
MPAAVGRFTLQLRHFGLFGAFIATVVLPTALSAVYLFAVADDQYASNMGFAVRSEEVSSALGLLAGLSSISGSSSSDTDILYHYLRSQELVAKIDKRLDLRAIYSKPTFDPVFAVSPSGTIEDLTAYWGRMVRVFYDKGTGLIELRVHAFDPQDARQIAEAIYEDSSDMVNGLSAIARADATRYAREELDDTTQRLSTARIALTEFRSRNQIVDPAASIQGQLGLLNSLQQQQAQAMIELSLLRETARPGDPRIAEAERRFAVIEQMIVEEKRKFGVGGGDAGDGEDYSTLVGEFERLTVEQEFAQRAYLAALTAFDTANAEAQRKSRYLAAYIGPTLAEEALYPKRLQLTGIIFAFALLIWSVGALIFYSVRDRR